MNTASPVVLVVAVEPDASVLSGGLGRAGYQFQLVRSWRDAETTVREDRFQAIVIAEQSLPENPAAFFQDLRAQTSAPIIIAGWGGPDVRTEMLLDGADAYLVRPIPDEILRARIRSLSSRRPQGQIEGGAQEPDWFRHRSG